MVSENPTWSKVCRHPPEELPAILIILAAKPFDDIQKRVAELLKDRILVGHAVFNDLKVMISVLKFCFSTSYILTPGTSSITSPAADTRYTILRGKIQALSKR